MRTIQNIFLACVLVSVSVTSGALAQSASAPDVYDMTIDGVKVIVQPTKANQIIAVTLGIQGGYAIAETDDPAIPGFTTQLTTASGPQRMTKEKYRAALSRLVTTIGGTAGGYGATYGLTCARPKFDESWKLFEDVVKAPRYDEEEFNRIRIQTLTEISARRQDPESWVNFAMDSTWAAGHRVGRVIQPADIQVLTIAALKEYHDRQLERSRMTIVIVGDVSKPEVEKKVHELLKGIPMGSFVKRPYDLVSGIAANDVVPEQRPLPTTYIVGRYAGPQRTDADYWAFRLGNLILSDRLYEEVRTKRNLSYSPYAYYGGSSGNYYGQVGVSTTTPDSAMHVIMRELNKIRQKGVTEKELRDTKESFITQVYMSQQSNLSEANRLYSNELETGDYRNAFRVIDQITPVTTADVQRAIATYLRTVYWRTIGDQTKIDRADFLFH